MRSRASPCADSVGNQRGAQKWIAGFFTRSAGSDGREPTAEYARSNRDTHLSPRRGKFRRLSNLVPTTPPLSPLGIQFTPQHTQSSSIGAAQGIPASVANPTDKGSQSNTTYGSCIEDVRGVVSVRTVEEFWHAQLDAIYCRRNPIKRKQIPELLAKYRGREAVLYRKVCEMYDLRPTKFYADSKAWAEFEGDILHGRHDDSCNSTTESRNPVLATISCFLQKLSCRRSAIEAADPVCIQGHANQSAHTSTERRRTTLLLGKRSSWEREFTGPNPRMDLFSNCADKPSIVGDGVSGVSQPMKAIENIVSVPAIGVGEAYKAPAQTALPAVDFQPRKVQQPIAEVVCPVPAPPVTESIRRAHDTRTNTAPLDHTRLNAGQLDCDASNTKADLSAVLDYYTHPKDSCDGKRDSCDDHRARLSSNITLRANRMQTSKCEDSKCDSREDSGLDLRVRNELKRKVDRFESPPMSQEISAKRFQGASSRACDSIRSDSIPPRDIPTSASVPTQRFQGTSLSQSLSQSFDLKVGHSVHGATSGATLSKEMPRRHFQNELSSETFEIKRAQSDKVVSGLSRSMVDSLDSEHMKHQSRGTSNHLNAHAANRFDNVPSPLRAGRAMDTRQRARLH